MPTTEDLLGGTLFLSLLTYVLLGGADFGGGVWDLLASGPRRSEQRRAVAAAIGPIWEANHVWLILAIVVLFTAFPRGFAVIGTALHIPLTMFLLGVVFRGSAFAFRGLDTVGDPGQRRWGLVFSLASAAAPLLLGMAVGALASGNIRIAGGQASAGDFVSSWLAPFPMAVGALCFSLCAYLAATYLTVEAPDQEIQEDFRGRALLAGVAVGIFALGALVLARSGAPVIWTGLVSRSWSLPFHLVAGSAAAVAFAALWRRRYRLARAAVAGHVAIILGGWAACQYPYLVVPDLTLASAAASHRTQTLLLYALAAGIPILLPSLWLLFRVFKSEVNRQRDVHH